MAGWVGACCASKGRIAVVAGVQLYTSLGGYATFGAPVLLGVMSD